MSPFAQSLRQAQILILEILQVFLWLKSSPSLTLDKIEHFETSSYEIFNSCYAYQNRDTRAKWLST